MNILPSNLSIFVAKSNHPHYTLFIYLFIYFCSFICS